MFDQEVPATLEITGNDFFVSDNDCAIFTMSNRTPGGNDYGASTAYKTVLAYMLDDMSDNTYENGAGYSYHDGTKMVFVEL